MDKLGSGFYNRLMKSWLEKNNTEMYSTHNEGKSVVTRTLKNKIYKYMTLISKSLYIDKLDDLVNEYNNTYHKTGKIKPFGVKNDIYMIQQWYIGIEINDKYPKFKVGDHVRY